MPRRKRRRRRRKKAIARLPKKVKKLIKAGRQAAKQQAIQQQGLQNIEEQSPFGSKQFQTDPETGQIIGMETQLSPEQMAILAQGQQLTQMGQQQAQQALGGYTPFELEGGLVGERERIEQEVFDRLTRDVAEQEATERQRAEQELYNRGIPFSDDPDSRYQRELGVITQRFDDVRADARRRATEIGGEEFQRSYGIGLGTHQQGLADIGALQGMGTGLMLPQFQGFQGPAYAPANPVDIWAAWQNVQQGQQALNQQQQALNRPLPQSPPPPPESPFE